MFTVTGAFSRPICDLKERSGAAPKLTMLIRNRDYQLHPNAAGGSII